MNLISTFIVWSWLLGISLLVPTTLPAGGAQKSIIQIRENNVRSPLITLKECNLLTSASYDSSVLTKIKVGTPVHILRVWENSESGKWLLVNVISQDFDQLFYKRGWVNIRAS
tara:strand:- start:491 stop:829 length:339 start_codon:yes stop_codon:yes gene_type:complete